MPVKVVDASVLGAYLFGETMKTAAAELIAGVELSAPSLLAYELTNIARKKIVSYPEQTSELIEALDMGLALPIHWMRIDYLSVLRLALKAGLTAYDACYLYLARELCVPLLSFDQQLIQATENFK